MGDFVSRANVQIYIDDAGTIKKLQMLDKEYGKLILDQKKFVQGSEGWNKVQAEIDKTTTQFNQLRKTLDLNKLSLRDLNAERQRTMQLLKTTTPDTPAYKELHNWLGKVNTRMTEVRTGLGPFAVAWKKVKDELLSLQGVMIAFLASGVITNWIKGIINNLGKLSDELADIQKTTGMTAKEAENLNKSFGSIDTRTARKELRDIAIVLGQMGYSKEDILQTTIAVDKLSVALADEFAGGAREVTDVMGKLRNVLTDSRTQNAAEDMLRLGNAMNVLGQEGLATGPVVAEFANRIGGIGVSLGLTSGQILGISATMQELNISAERGSTAVVGILQKMTTHTEDFAKVAGMELKAFGDLVNNDIYQAFVKVTKGAAENAKSAVALGELLKDLSVDGARVGEVFTKIGNATELLNEKVVTASESLTNTDSILNEFSIKNNTLGAQLDKLSKDLTGLFVNDDVKNAITGLVIGVQRFVGALKDNASAIISVGKVLGSLLISWGVFKLTTMANGEALKNFFKNFQQSFTLMQSQVKQFGIVSVAESRAMGLWRASVDGLKSGVKALWNTFKENPLGWIMAGVTLGITLYQSFAKSVRTTADAFNELEQVRKDNTENTYDEAAALATLFEQLKRTSAGTQERADILADLAGKYGVYLNDIGTEKEFMDKLNEAYEKNIRLLLKQAAAKAQKDEMAVLLKERLRLEKQLSDLAPALQMENPDVTQLQQGSTSKIAFNLMADLQRVNNEIDKVITSYDKLIAQYTATEEPLVGPAGPSGAGDSNFTPEPAKAKAEKTYKTYDLLTEKFRDLNQRLKDYVDTFNEGDDELQKRVNAVNKKYRELLDSNTDAINKLQEQIDDANTNADKAAKAGDKTGLAYYKKQADDLLNQQKLFKDEKIKIVEQGELEEKAVRSKYALERLNNEVEEGDKLAKAKRDAQIKIFLETASPFVKELYETELHYQALLKLAKKYGIDTAALERKRMRELQNIKKAQLQQDAGELLNSIQQYYDVFNSLVSSVTALVSATQDAELANDKRRKNDKIENLDKKLEQGFITEKQYKQKLEALNEEYDEKERETRNKQAEREKAMRMFQAGMDVILAPLSVLRATGSPALAIAAGIAAGIAFAAAAATPIPEFEKGTRFGANGARLKGPKHNSPSRGLDITNPETGEVVARAEGGEVLLSAATAANNAAVVDALLHSSQYEGGRRIDFSNATPRPVGFDFSSAFIEAASFSTPSFSGRPSYFNRRNISSTPTGNDNDTLMKEMVMLQKKIINQNERLIDSVNNQEKWVSIKEFEKKQTEIKEIKNLASL